MSVVELQLTLKEEKSLDTDKDLPEILNLRNHLIKSNNSFRFLLMSGSYHGRVSLGAFVGKPHVISVLDKMK